MRGVCVDGDNLRAVRILRGLTQEGLSDLSGLDVKTVRKAERGGRLDLSTVDRLAVALETAMGRLVRREAPDAGCQARRDAVLRWLAAWDARDMDGILAIYHERATFHLPGGPVIPFHGIFRGHDEIRVGYETAWGTCRTAVTEPEEVMIHAFGDKVILEGPCGVYLPSGEVVRLWCVQIYTFDGDRVIDHRVEYDTLEFARVMELPAEGARDEDRGSSR
ncbi:MAG: hypothetical protein BGO49_19025 [Planctomycetales bacterium 71-10]|nr:MAG: hypothetical protein BGO49_19025 [Planctomycetales bacterium 71-10]